MQNSLAVNTNSMAQCACEPFNFSKPELWPEWIEQFDQYLSLTNLNCISDKEKIDILCYKMGSMAKEILLEIKPDYATGISYEDIKTEFSKYLMIKKHIIIERDKFHNRIIRPNETIDAFISDLYKLVGRCNYGPVENHKLREQIFRAIKHSETKSMFKEKENKVQKEHFRTRLSNRRFYWQVPYRPQEKDCEVNLKERRLNRWYTYQTVKQNDIISDLNKKAEKLCITHNNSKVDS